MTCILLLKVTGTYSNNPWQSGVLVFILPSLNSIFKLIAQMHPPFLNLAHPEL